MERYIGAEAQVVVQDQVQQVLQCRGAGAEVQQKQRFRGAD